MSGCAKLQAENASLRELVVKTNSPKERFTSVEWELIAERDQLKAQLEAVTKERDEANELLIMQLAAISTASIQNTEASHLERIGPDNPYYSTAYADVCRAIDREMDLRAQLTREQERVKVAREALNHILFKSPSLLDADIIAKSALKELGE